MVELKSLIAGAALLVAKMTNAQTCGYDLSSPTLTATISGITSLAAYGDSWAALAGTSVYTDSETAVEGVIGEYLYLGTGANFTALVDVGDGAYVTIADGAASQTMVLSLGDSAKALNFVIQDGTIAGLSAVQSNEADLYLADGSDEAACLLTATSITDMRVVPGKSVSSDVFYLDGTQLLRQLVTSCSGTITLTPEAIVDSSDAAFTGVQRFGSLYVIQTSSSTFLTDLTTTFEIDTSTITSTGSIYACANGDNWDILIASADGLHGATSADEFATWTLYAMVDPVTAIAGDTGLFAAGGDGVYVFSPSDTSGAFRSMAFGSATALTVTTLVSVF